MGPHIMLDGGIKRSLDLVQETAGINPLMFYSQLLATDHGVPPREMRDRKLPAVRVKHHEQYLKKTLRHRVPDGSYEYANRDLLQEVQGPAHLCGIKVYARILE